MRILFSFFIIMSLAVLAFPQKALLASSGSGSGSASSSGSSSNAGSSAYQMEPIEVIDPNTIPGSSLSFEDIFSRIIGLFTLIITLAAFAGLIYGGFLYITAGGDTSKAELARKNITWSLIGVILTVTSYVIIKYVANWTTIDVTRDNSSSGNFQTGTSSTASQGGLSVTGFEGNDPANTIIDMSQGNVVISYQLNIKTPPKKGETIEVSITKQGAAPITVSRETLSVTSENWSSAGYVIGAVYSGGGQDGQKARLIIITSTGGRSEIIITLKEKIVQPTVGGLPEEDEDF